MPDVSDHSNPTDPTDETPPSAARHSSTGEPLQPPEHEAEGAVPPGYDWPTHGGYLGCLVGTIAACPIVGFIAANIWALYHVSRLAFPLFALLILASIAAVIAAGRLGWALGRRFYRYYPQPRPSWGESDETTVTDGEGPHEAAAAKAETTPDGGLDTTPTNGQLAEVAPPDEPGA